MRHLIGIGVLVAVALALRFWVHVGIGVDISIHDVYRVVPLSIIGSWLLMGIVSVWLVIAAYTFIRRHS
jgi:hypothetical protein